MAEKVPRTTPRRRGPGKQRGSRNDLEGRIRHLTGIIGALEEERVRVIVELQQLKESTP